MEQRWSLNVFNLVKGPKPLTKLLKLLAEVFTLTGDEALFFPIAALVGFGLLYHSSGGASPAGEAAARRTLRMYGDLGAVCLLEGALKLAFRRARPPWKPPAAFACMLGERYSFPSGHAMRAAYTAGIFIRGLGPVSLAGDIPGVPTWILSAVLVAWASAVALSRVALGKHYLGDVLAGLALGAAVSSSGYPTECSPAGPGRVALASLFSLQAIGIALTPSIRGNIPGWPYMAAINVVFWLTLPFAA